MTEKTIYDDIRPYRDDEIPEAMQRIADSASFPLLAAYVFPDRDVHAVKEMIKSIRTIRQFQTQVMYDVNKQVISRTMTAFTYGGIEKLSPNVRYLFIGNHRDIVLDSCLMQYALYINGFETSEITFGANLMQSQLIIDIGKSNKMFKVERPGNNIKEFYRESSHLSAYIRHTICNKRQSVWMAQRNGRTKDGKDLTDQGIIKMLGMSRTDNKIDSIAELNIVPVAISYEWESCDILKALELYEKNLMGHYVKKPGEDVNSILTGFVQPKGRVHLEFCKPLERSELLQFDKCTLNGFNRAVAHLIDQRIHQAYRFTPNNYIAHDLRYGRNEFAGMYTESDKKDFIDHLSLLKPYESGCDMDTLVDILLGIYSNPIDLADR